MLKREGAGTATSSEGAVGVSLAGLEGGGAGGGGCVTEEPSSSISMRRTTAEMLSRPPASLASWTRRVEARAGSPESEMVSRIFGSESMPVRPSLQRRKISPASKASVWMSNWTEASIPTARVTMFLGR